MVKRYSISDAIQATEAAEKQRELNQEHEKNLAKDIAAQNKKLSKSWSEQRVQLIEAALDGKNKARFACLHQAEKLLMLNFSIKEVGLIKKIPDDGVKWAIKKVRSAFSDFVRGVPPGVVSFYYLDQSDFESANWEILERLMKAAYAMKPAAEDFSGDLIYQEDVPISLKKNQVKNLKTINECLALYLLSLEYSDATEAQKKSNKFFKDSHRFTHGEVKREVLEVESVKNYFEISWKSANTNIQVDTPLFSPSGLLWLSGDAGQITIENIFDAISQSAESGERELSFEVQIHDSAYYIDGYRSKKVCSPRDLGEILEMRGFKARVIFSGKKIAHVKASW